MGGAVAPSGVRGGAPRRKNGNLPPSRRILAPFATSHIHLLFQGKGVDVGCRDGEGGSDVEARSWLGEQRRGVAVQVGDTALSGVLRNMGMGSGMGRGMGRGRGRGMGRGRGRGMGRGMGMGMGRGRGRGRVRGRGRGRGIRVRTHACPCTRASACTRACAA